MSWKWKFLHMVQKISDGKSLILKIVEYLQSYSDLNFWKITFSCHFTSNQHFGNFWPNGKHLYILSVHLSKSVLAKKSQSFKIMLCRVFLLLEVVWQDFYRSFLRTLYCVNMQASLDLGGSGAIPLLPPPPPPPTDIQWKPL